MRSQLSDHILKPPPGSGIHKCHHPRCHTCPFLQDGQTKNTFSATKERNIHGTLNCKSRNLIYLIHCKKCNKQYIGETKYQLNKRFGEHRHFIQNHDLLLLPHILTSLATRSTIFFSSPWNVFKAIITLKKACKAHLIDKAMTLEPNGITRGD